MNTLVTGGSGFIGSSLVSKLLKDGNNVIILSRDKRRIDNHFKERVELLEADICEPTSLEILPKTLHMDIIFHLAASLSYFGNKRKLFEANVKGTENLLRWAEKNRVKKFIFTSSIEAMGTIREKDIPADETYACNPVSPYGTSKLQAEKQVKEFAREIDPSAVIVRLGNVYGPGSPAFILPIVDAILKKNKLLQFLPFYKDHYLHPVFVENAADGIIKAAERGKSSETYIIAGDEYVTIGELFEQIAEIIDSEIKKNRANNLFNKGYIYFRKYIHMLQNRADLIDYFIAGKGKRIHRAYSTEKALKELNYYPNTKLKEGIKVTIDWLKKEGYLSI